MVVEIGGIALELVIWLLSVDLIWDLQMPVAKRLYVTGAFGIRLLYAPSSADICPWHDLVLPSNEATALFPSLSTASSALLQPTTPGLPQLVSSPPSSPKPSSNFPYLAPTLCPCDHFYEPFTRITLPPTPKHQNSHDPRRIQNTVPHATATIILKRSSPPCSLRQAMIAPGKRTRVARERVMQQRIPKRNGVTASSNGQLGSDLTSQYGMMQTRPILKIRRP